MTWKVEYHADVQKKVAELDPGKRRDIYSFLQERLISLNNPRDIGADLGSYWRYKEDGLRVICDIQDQAKTIRVIEIDNLPKKSTARS